MTRTVEEWRGATPDTPPPPRVRVRVFDAKGGRCHMCGRKIPAGERWTCEHVVAIINGGENRERNLDVTCCWCLPIKNGRDVALKSDTYDKRRKHLGVRKPSRFPGSRDSGLKKKINGSVVPRCKM
jgi:5-methylcytosine-specific restriction protein A